ALLSAEIARLEHRDLEAMRLYEKAIEAARASRFSHNEGIASEIAARFYKTRGFHTIADAYLRLAHSCYLRWGAHGKVRQLEHIHPALIAQKHTETSASIAVRADQLDLLSVVMASQSISGEMVLGRLIEKLVRVAIEQAGAQRGYLLRRDGDAFT